MVACRLAGLRLSRGPEIGGSLYRNDFEVDEVGPTGGPEIKSVEMGSFYKLEATRAGRFHPAVDVDDLVGKHTAGTLEASTDGRELIGREMFDDHEKHERSVT